ncbi:MAG: BrnT family toxin [Elusimicrobia bacterium]|nr:BrnT family toxin [Elusimicrobiota bacterium]
MLMRSSVTITIYDPEHSHSDGRFVTVGMSAKDNLVVVVHADRANGIRIISARRATGCVHWRECWATGAPNR